MGCSRRKRPGLMAMVLTHRLANHTFNNPILSTYYPKALWHRQSASLHGVHTPADVSPITEDRMRREGGGLGRSQGLTLRISLEPKPESMRVSRSISRMAQATNRCRLGPGSPVHSTWESRSEKSWPSFCRKSHPALPYPLPTSHQPPSLGQLTDFSFFSALPPKLAGPPPIAEGHLGRGIPS